MISGPVSIRLTSVSSLAKAGPLEELRCLRLTLGGEGGLTRGQHRGVGPGGALLRGLDGEKLQVLVRT